MRSSCYGLVTCCVLFLSLSLRISMLLCSSSSSSSSWEILASRRRFSSAKSDLHTSSTAEIKYCFVHHSHFTDKEVRVKSARTFQRSYSPAHQTVHLFQPLLASLPSRLQPDPRNILEMNPLLQAAALKQFAALLGINSVTSCSCMSSASRLLAFFSLSFAVASTSSRAARASSNSLW